MVSFVYHPRNTTANKLMLYNETLAATLHRHTHPPWLEGGSNSSTTGEMYQQHGGHKIGAYAHHQVSIGGDGKPKAQQYMKDHPVPTDPTSILDGIVRFLMLVSCVIFAVAVLILAIEVPAELKREADTAVLAYDLAAGIKPGNPQCEKNLYADFHPIGFTTTVVKLNDAQAKELRGATAVNAPTGAHCDTCPSGEEPVHINVFHMCKLPTTGTKGAIKDLCGDTKTITPTGGVAVAWNTQVEVSSAVLICVTHAEKETLISDGRNVDPDLLKERLSKWVSKAISNTKAPLAHKKLPSGFTDEDGKKKTTGKMHDAFLTTTKCGEPGDDAKDKTGCCTKTRKTNPALSITLSACNLLENTAIAAKTAAGIACYICAETDSE